MQLFDRESVDSDSKMGIYLTKMWHIILRTELTRRIQGEKHWDFTLSSVEDRASVLYATFLPITTAFWRQIFSQKSVANADYIRL